MPDTQQPIHSLVTQFVTAFGVLQEDKTSARTQEAILLGQNLLQLLPDESSFYSLCSCCLAHCLLITWQKTDAEKKRDRDLLNIIGSRVNSAVDRCLPDDRYRPWYLHTQQVYYCIVRNFSARLEDDFWDHEHINTLNASIIYAKSAWHMLRNNVAEARHAADNLGNLYMSRYEYLGRPGDLDDALMLNTWAVILSVPMASEFQFQSYVKQATRLSLWSLFEDQADEINDAINYMDQVAEGRTWEIENQGVTPTCGSSYAVLLGFFSQVYCRAFIRRKGRVPNVEKYLSMAVLRSQNACRGIKEIDPGRLLCLNDSASALLQLYLSNSISEYLEEAVQTIVFALKLSETLLTPTGIPRRDNGIRLSGHGGGISSLVMVDNRTSSHHQSSLKERRYQRWIVRTLEISADLLLARYKRDQDPQDLAIAILSLKLSIQGSHSWGTRSSKKLFKLNQALRESLRTLESPNHAQVQNILCRANKSHLWARRLGELYTHFRNHRANETDPFAPLARNPTTAIVLGREPVNDHSWQPIIPRGSYDHDMQLSTDAPNVLTSDTVSAAEHVQREHYQLDPLLDHLFRKLDSADPETVLIRSMWDKLYCSAGASLKRAEVYQRTLAIFIEKGDLEAAAELSRFAEAILGHLELHLMEPDQYLSELSHASNLATTMACVLLTHGGEPWKAILALENGRELGSRHGLNAVRSYGFEPKQELLPQVHVIRDQLQAGSRAAQRYSLFTGDQSASRSRNLIRLLQDFVRSEAYLEPFGPQQCMWEARSAFIIHLITSKLGTYALITTSDGFQKHPLPHCTHEQLCIRAATFRRAIEMCQNHEARKGSANQKLRSMLMWLWKTVAKPIIQFLHLKKLSWCDSNLPRIKWIACGVFSQLPIHAAGLYSGDTSDYMDQYAVSSYLSSIRGSVASQQRKPLVPYYQNANREFTLFGMSTSPAVPEGKLADLAVTEEKRRIFASLGDSFTNNAIDNCNLGVARNMMHWARIIHFTCHGLPHPTDPSKSRLVLLRDDKEPCTVAQIRDMDIPNALLLYLSACHSAIDPQASGTDEIIHLAKAFLLAGFPTVIGTLWQAYEASALDIATVFYAQVAMEWKAERDEPDPDVFPRALHHAVCKWREDGNMWKPIDWASWVCFAS